MRLKQFEALRNKGYCGFKREDLVLKNASTPASFSFIFGLSNKFSYNDALAWSE